MRKTVVRHWITTVQILSYFNCSTLQHETFKEFCGFLEIKYANFPRIHVHDVLATSSCWKSFAVVECLKIVYIIDWWYSKDFGKFVYKWHKWNLFLVSPKFIATFSYNFIGFREEGSSAARNAGTVAMLENNINERIKEFFGA